MTASPAPKTSSRESTASKAQSELPTVETMLAELTARENDLFASDQERWDWAEARIQGIASALGAHIPSTRAFLRENAERTKSIAEGLKRFPQPLLRLEILFDTPRYVEVLRAFKTHGHDVSLTNEQRAYFQKFEPAVPPTEPVVASI
jgi:hypothetical protein